MPIKRNIGTFSTEEFYEPLADENFTLEGDCVVYRPNRKKTIEINIPCQFSACNSCRHLSGIVRWDRFGNRCDLDICLKGNELGIPLCQDFENKNIEKEITWHDVSVAFAVENGLVRFVQPNFFKKIFYKILRLLTKNKKVV
jgi:hypothetical protein